MDMIKVDQVDEHIYLIGLDRPAKHNALTHEMVCDLEDLLTELRDEPSILVLYSTTPGVFVAGADIGELLQRDEEAALRGLNSRLFERLERHRWPTIAVIDGPALGGGCELALACDLRVASERAVFAQPELSLGIIAAAGGNWRLAQAVGTAMARDMLYTGRRIEATDVCVSGLVSRLVDPEDALSAGIELAQSIARHSWRAVELTKLALRANRPDTSTFDLVAQALLFESEEKRTRMTTFLDRSRNPRPSREVVGETG